MNRREFIKTSGVIGGAAMLGINPLQALIAEAVVEPMSSATLAEQAKLYPAAKKEGQVTFYQASSTEAGSMLAQAFEKKYPGIKCNVYRGTSGDCHTKLDTEWRAGKTFCDVFHSSLYGGFLTMTDKGRFMKYRSPEIKNYWEKWTNPDYYAPVRFTTMCIAWNSDIVSKEEAPKSYADGAKLAQQKKWFGKICIGDPNGSANAVAWIYSMVKKYGDTAWDWIRIWGEADAGTFSSHGAMDKEILAGKYPISMSDLDYRVNENIIAGTPLTGIWPKDGVSVSPGPAAIIKEAPHPNAAKLFYNYFLSSEGCQAFQKGGSSNAARKSGVIKWEHMPGLDQLNIIDIDYRQLDKDEKDLLAKFEQVFGGAKKRAKSK